MTGPCDVRARRADACLPPRASARFFEAVIPAARTSGRRRSARLEGTAQTPPLAVLQDAVHHGRVRDDRDDLQLAAAARTDERIDLVDASQEPRPGAPAGHGVLRAHKAFLVVGRLDLAQGWFVGPNGKVRVELAAGCTHALYLSVGGEERVWKLTPKAGGLLRLTRVWKDLPTRADAQRPR